MGKGIENEVGTSIFRSTDAWVKQCTLWLHENMEAGSRSRKSASSYRQIRT